MNILSFPNELTLGIFRYLHMRDLGACAQVCKLWNLVASDNKLWKAVALSNFPPPHKTSYINWRLYCKENSNHFLQKIIFSRKNLTPKILQLPLTTAEEIYKISGGNVAFLTKYTPSSTHLEIWNLNTKKRQLSVHYCLPIQTLEFASSRIFIGAGNSIFHFTIEIPKQEKILEGHKNPILNLQLSEKTLLSASQECIRVWNLHTLQCVRVLDYKGKSITTLGGTKKWIACGTEAGTVLVWNACSSFEPEYSFLFDGPIGALTFFKDTIFVRSAHSCYRKEITGEETKLDCDYFQIEGFVFIALDYLQNTLIFQNLISGESTSIPFECDNFAINHAGSNIFFANKEKYALLEIA